MIIKKFQGKTEAEAVDTAKKELGNNVVVMNTFLEPGKNAENSFYGLITARGVSDLKNLFSSFSFHSDNLLLPSVFLFRQNIQPLDVCVFGAGEGTAFFARVGDIG